MMFQIYSQAETKCRPAYGVAKGEKMNLKTFAVKWGLQILAAVVLSGILLYSALVAR